MGKQSLGFTLIELMIVVGIVGILGAIAYPSYVDYLRESRRSDAHNALLTMANEQEKFFLANSTYATQLGDVWDQGVVSLEDNYTLSVPVANGTTFTVQAVPVAGGPQAQDADCLAICLDDANRKTDCAGNDNSGACW